MDRSQELALVARLREQDPAALDEIYDAHCERLYTFLLRLSRRRDVAEDLLQETWLRLVHHAHRLQPDTVLVPWLLTVARNLFRSHCRGRTANFTTGSEAPMAAGDGLADTPFELTAASELERRLEVAIGGLPPKYREVVLLVAVEQLSLADAAAVLRITPAALRKRLSRARALLSAQLFSADETAADVPTVLASRSAHAS